MKTSRILVAGAVALLTPALALAQQTDSEEDETATELPRILVTAGRTPVEQQKSGRAFTVIEGEQIERSQTRYVPDVLRQVPGVHVSRTGPFGGLTQIRMRGSEGNHVLVLVDGVPIGSTSFGGYDFSGMQVGQIDRIEVLRGPQSAFWGADAMAGVINIITKRGKRDGVDVGAQTEYGSDNTRLVGGYIRGGNEFFDGSLAINRRITDGFNTSRTGSEKDGDDNLTATGRFNLDVTENLRIDGAGRFVDRLSEIDAAPTGIPMDSDNETGTIERSGTLGATWTSPDQAWDVSARISGSTEERERFTAGVYTGGSFGDHVSATFQSSYTFQTPYLANATHKVTGGVEWERERYKNFAPAATPRRERDVESYIGEYRGEFFEQLYINAAIRHDRNSAFEDATTYSAAVAWQIPGTGTRLHASVGTGVTSPHFFELFGFALNFVGNPALQPEESFGWDVGVEQQFLGGDVVTDVTYFNQDLTNKITGFGNTVVNTPGTSTREGVEVSVSAVLWEGFSATGSYTYLEAREANGAREVRRPQHSGSLHVAQRFLDDSAEVFAEVIYNGDMIDNVFLAPAFARTLVPMDSYTVVNVGGSLKLNEHFELYGRVENAFDEQYEEVFGYSTQGRTAFVGLKGKI